ncbi:hypothetical protein M8818_002995 [Zalaria obscura]|uniref:Uncharacterized protein n=1 Tax=Zalaria obscura TaxID=2024903 RepID=A0ACC3SFP1_9PEZI
MGSPHEQSPYCSMLARETGRVVLSVDYRMGPLEQFPSATHDAEDVLAAVLDSEGATPAGRALRKDIAKRVSHHRFPRPGMTMKTKIEGLIDSTRVSVSGFSSGGNIALNLILSVKDWPSLFPKDWPNPIPTLLFFPSFDQTLLPHERPEQGTDPNSFMSRNAAVMTPYWLPGDLKNHPRANPGLCEMSGLHPKAEIFLVLPEHDSLAVQSDEWVQKMREQGKEACLVVRREKGMKHGWTQFPDTFLAGHEKGRKQDCVKASVEFVRLADEGVPCFERKISRADGC